MRNRWTVCLDPICLICVYLLGIQRFPNVFCRKDVQADYVSPVYIFIKYPIFFFKIILDEKNKNSLTAYVGQ